MTVLTAAEMAAQQANAENILSLSNVVRNKAMAAAEELCGVDNVQAARMRTIASDASIAVAAAHRMLASGYGIDIPTNGVNITPNFGGNK